MNIKMTSAGEVTFLVCRHGETLWNIANRLQGHKNSCLSDKGNDQARALGKRLTSIDFDILYCSDLGRARETADLISGYTGHEIFTDKELRERNLGVLEGMTPLENKKAHLKIYTPWISGDPGYVIPSGESRQQFYQRTTHRLESLCMAHVGKTILLVVHGGVLDCFFRYVTRLPLNHPSCFEIPNSGLNIISFGDYYGSERWVIKTWGDIGHIQNIGYLPGFDG